MLKFKLLFTDGSQVVIFVVLNYLLTCKVSFTSMMEQIKAGSMSPHPHLLGNIKLSINVDQRPLHEKCLHSGHQTHIKTHSVSLVLSVSL